MHRSIIDSNFYQGFALSANFGEHEDEKTLEVSGGFSGRPCDLKKLVDHWHEQEISYTVILHVNDVSEKKVQGRPGIYCEGHITCIKH